MNTLDKIIESKLAEVKQLAGTYQNSERSRQFNSLKQALLQPGLSIIGEIKRQSPSKGVLATIENPVKLAEQYRAGGVRAISVLTDGPFFGGSAADLTAVANALPSMPVLRKEFIVDERQIIESVQLGADAILLIVAVLGEKTKALLDSARHQGLEVLVEVHTQAELDYALSIGADIIGINSRNLQTFAVDLTVPLQLIRSIPDKVVTVAESGLRTTAALVNVEQAGFDAALVGEGLVTEAGLLKAIGAGA